MTAPLRPGLAARPGSVTLVGLGNIGSFCVEALARVTALRHLILVDRDHYEAANLGSQRIARTTEALGRPKAEVQAAHVRRLRPDVEVQAYDQDVAEVPLGALRAGLLLTGLDSLVARMHVNAAACRLGMPWVDAGVDPASGLVRMSSYQPGPHTACYECALDDADYEQRLGSIHPCAIEGAEGRTRGHPGSGAVAGAFLACAAESRLNGWPEADRFRGMESLWDTRRHQHLRTAYPPNPCCRFDHRTWDIRPCPALPGSAPLRDLLAALMDAVDAEEGSRLNLPGRRLSERAQCPRCGHVRMGWHVTGRLPSAEQTCAGCGQGRLLAPGFHTLPLEAASLPPPVLEMPWRQLGLAGGDVLEVITGGQVRRLELPFTNGMESGSAAPDPDGFTDTRSQPNSQFNLTGHPEGNASGSSSPQP